MHENHAKPAYVQNVDRNLLTGPGGEPLDEVLARLRSQVMQSRSLQRFRPSPLPDRAADTTSVQATASECDARPGGSAVVEATERLYSSLFAAAMAFAAAATAWGLVIAPFNGFRDDHSRSVVVGVVLIGVAAAGTALRKRFYGLVRRQPAWLLILALIGVAALWTDGGWRSSYYLASYTAIAVAAIVGGLRWALACAAVLASGYVGGLAVHGYSWERLQELHDADSVVANAGGYFIAAYFFAAPVAWLGGYVARINQVLGEHTARRRGRTAHLSVREVQVVQLIAGGASNEDVARRLVISPRTVQTHVQRAMKKSAARNRTELAVLAVQEGLLPLRPARP